ncbi:MAG: transporter [Pirellulaceae bacterium]|nr:transporter [Pirellulaceae bacterium]
MFRITLLVVAILVASPSLAGSADAPDAQWYLNDIDPAGALARAELIQRSILRGQLAEPFDPLNADRPDFTESPTTMGLRRLQLEAGWTYLHDTFEGVKTDVHVLPELLLRFGLTERIELRLAWPGYESHKETDANLIETASYEGGTDPWFGCKLQVSKQQVWLPESAMIVSVSAPVGARVWTSDHVDTVVNYIYAWDLTDRLSVAASTGAWWTEQDGDAMSVIHQSAVVGFALTERLGTYCEWFGLFYHGSQTERPEHYVNGGFTFLVTENLQFDWRLGVGLTEASEDLFTGVGFVIRW